MLMIGCDYHPSAQQIAVVDTETGDYSEHRLKHSDGEAEKFYRDLKLRAVKVRVGLEATGHRRCFERLLMELDFEVWIGDAQSGGSRSAAITLASSSSGPDAHTALNQAIAMNEGIQRRGGLRSVQGRKRLEQIPLGPWGTRRRSDLLVLLDQMNNA